MSVLLYSRLFIDSPEFHQMLGRGRGKGIENPYEVTLEYFYYSKGRGEVTKNFFNSFVSSPLCSLMGISTLSLQLFRVVDCFERNTERLFAR